MGVDLGISQTEFISKNVWTSILLQSKMMGEKCDVRLF